jgi:hypothetical protein
VTLFSSSWENRKYIFCKNRGDNDIFPGELMTRSAVVWTGSNLKTVFNRFHCSKCRAENATRVSWMVTWENCSFVFCKNGGCAGIFLNKNDDIFVSVWAISNPKTLFNKLDCEESNAQHCITQSLILVEKTSVLCFAKMVDAPGFYKMQQIASWLKNFEFQHWYRVFI